MGGKGKEPAMFSVRCDWCGRLWDECWVEHTGQVLAPAWPRAGGRHWVKALDVKGPCPWGSDVALRDLLCCCLSLWPRYGHLLLWLQLFWKRIIIRKKTHIRWINENNPGCPAEKKKLSMSYDSDTHMTHVHAEWWTERKDALSWNEWYDLPLVFEAVLTKSPWIRAIVWIEVKKKGDRRK